MSITLAAERSDWRYLRAVWLGARPGRAAMRTDRRPTPSGVARIPQRDEAELAARARAGTAAFGRWWNVSRRRPAGRAAVLQNPDDADDAAQDAFLSRWSAGAVRPRRPFGLADADRGERATDRRGALRAPGGAAGAGARRGARARLERSGAPWASATDRAGATAGAPAPGVVLFDVEGIPTPRSPTSSASPRHGAVGSVPSRRMLRGLLQDWKEEG